MKKTRTFERTMLLLLGLVCICNAGFAQRDQASWANLNALHPGQKILVAGATSKKFAAEFVSVSDTAIAYRTAKGDQSIAKQDVRSVKLPSHKHRVRSTLIVAGVGAGVGAGIGAASHQSCSAPNFCFNYGAGELAAVGAVLGGVGGAVVGVFLPEHNTVYQVAPH